MARGRLDGTRSRTGRSRPPGAAAASVARAASLAIALLAAARAAASDGASPERLTLDRAVELALASNPAIHAATLAVEGDGEAVAAARSRYLPVVSTQAHAGQLLAPVELQFDKGALGSIPGVGPVPDRDTTVRSSQDLTFGLSTSVMQPLTQLYSAHQGVRLARIGREADRAQLRAERAQVVADVRRLYHRLFATEGTLASAREQLATQHELARLAAQRVIQQVALRADELQARGAVASAAVQVRKLETALATGKEQLNRLMGRDVRTPFEVAEAGELASDVPDLEAARAEALRERPELRQAQLGVEKAEAELSLKRWENVPEVSVGVSHTSTFGVETLPRNIAIAGAFAKWDLDFGRRRREAAQKSLAIEEARARARDAEAAVLVEVGDRWRKLADARDEAEAARLALEALRARAPVVANRYRLEAALLGDALEVQAALSKATHDHEEALLSLWSAQADLELALGRAPR